MISLLERHKRRASSLPSYDVAVAIARAVKQSPDVIWPRALPVAVP